MRAMLSKKEGKIIHKDIILHACFILPCEENRTAS
jgi:hypothetical protein